MTAWAGEIWQLVASSTSSALRAEIGVTWGRGLLEESVEETGALALVLTALRRVLERPVDRGPGRSGHVRVDIRLDADVCSLRARGSVEALRAAWHRLPHLFARPLIAEGLRPHAVPALPWVEDLLARTGDTGLAVHGQGGLGERALEEARRLLRELDPRHGTIGCVFWTDESSLLGTVHASAPLRPGPLVAVLVTGTGTRRLIDRAGTALTVRTGDLAEGEQLEQYLAHVLRRVPHLTLADQGPRTHPAGAAARAGGPAAHHAHGRGVHHRGPVVHRARRRHPCARLPQRRRGLGDLDVRGVTAQSRAVAPSWSSSQASSSARCSHLR